MKIAHRLWVLAGLAAAGLAGVAALSHFALTSVRSELRALTTQAAPLQVRMLEMQERSERLLGALLRLSYAKAADELQRVTDSAASQLHHMGRLREEIRALDAHAAQQLGPGTEFAAAHEQISAAARRRLADDAAYRSETEAARSALARAEQQTFATRQAALQLDTEAAAAAGRALAAERRLAAQARQALAAQAWFKDMALLVAQAEAAAPRGRLQTLRERLEAPPPSPAATAADDPLHEARAAAARLWERLMRDADGLLALRARAQAGAEGGEAAYAAQRKAVLALIDEQAARLAALADGLEVQGIKQRRALEAAQRARSEPGGAAARTETVALDIRELGAGLRQLMLAADARELQHTHTALRQKARALGDELKVLQATLVRMGRAPLAEQAQGALQAIGLAGGAIDQVATRRAGLLESEAAMAQSLARLKAAAARQAEAGERQLQSAGARQGEASAAVDRRVAGSLVLIAGLALGVAGLVGVVGAWTARGAGRRLSDAVAVAEQLARGRP